VRWGCGGGRVRGGARGRNGGLVGWCGVLGGGVGWVGGGGEIPRHHAFVRNKRTNPQMGGHRARKRGSHQDDVKKLGKREKGAVTSNAAKTLSASNLVRHGKVTGQKESVVKIRQYSLAILVVVQSVPSLEGGTTAIADYRGFQRKDRRHSNCQGGDGPLKKKKQERRKRIAQKDSRRHSRKGMRVKTSIAVRRKRIRGKGQLIHCLT